MSNFDPDISDLYTLIPDVTVRLGFTEYTVQGKQTVVAVELHRLENI